jgi:hypothetical protein
MGLFNRKKKDTILEIPHKCQWKDMPWYMEIHYDGSEKTASYQIIEPYICISGCGKRVDKVLEKEEWHNIDVATREKYYEEIREKYKNYLKPRAVVEDMINDILLVQDKAHLEMVEKLRDIPHKGCGTSTGMNEVKKNEMDTGEMGYQWRGCID